MSLTEISGGAVEGRVATPAAFLARLEELAGDGSQVERVQNSLVAGCMPPLMCAAVHSPDPQDGRYSVGDILASLEKQLGSPPPALRSAFGVNAGAGYEGAPIPFDISLDVSASGGMKP